LTTEVERGNGKKTKLILAFNLNRHKLELLLFVVLKVGRAEVGFEVVIKIS